MLGLKPFGLFLEEPIVPLHVEMALHGLLTQHPAWCECEQCRPDTRDEMDDNTGD